MRISVATGFSKGRIESFYKFHFRKVSNGRYIEYALILVLLIVAAIFLFVIENITVVIISLVTIVVLFSTYSYRTYYAVKRMLKKNEMNSRTYKIIITENDITFEEEGVVKIYKWTDVVRFCEIDLCYYIYVSSNVALVLPKFVLKPAEKDELVLFAKQSCKYKKYRFFSAEEMEGVV